MTDDSYYTIRSAEALTGRAGRPSSLRVAALFASLAIALTVVAVPRLGSPDRDVPGEPYAMGLPYAVDPIVTGSIRAAEPSGLLRGSVGGTDASDGRTYVVRRSVLTGSSVCVMERDGSRRGNC